jgi:DNA (cytosine-5)-methyltransferase 1
MPFQKLRKKALNGVQPRIFSFSSGGGLLDLGFEKEGYEVAFVNEISPSFMNAYIYARSKMGLPQPKYGYFNLDINKFLSDRKSELVSFVRDTQEEHRLAGFIGGPPCPDFSIAGKNKGASGRNGKLSLSYVKLITEVKPDFFLFENVKGLWQTARHRAYYEELKTMLHSVGYCTSERLCNALEFGAPQDRERIILFGVAKDVVTNCGNTKEITNFPWSENMSFNAEIVKGANWCLATKFGCDSSPPIAYDMKQLTVQYWFDRNDVEHHPNANNHFKPRSGIAKMKTIQEGDVSHKSYKRLHRYRYSPTAAYGNNEVHLHPYKERRISAAEAMAIQSLPKEFELPPDMSLSDMFKMIGNGVPFLLSKGIAKTIRQYLEENVCPR